MAGLKDIREQKSDDLRSRVAELREENFRAACVSERLAPQKHREIRARGKEIARILTVLRQRELAESAGAESLKLGERLKSAPRGSSEARRLRAGVRRLQRMEAEVRRVTGS